MITIIINIQNNLNISDIFGAENLQTIRNIGFTLALALPLSACQSDTQGESAWNLYQKQSEALVAATAKAPLVEVAKDALALVATAKEILPLVIQKQDQCKQYLDVALSAADSMTQLTLDEIERDYHADGKLPAVTGALCYHAKDLLVHPATVAVIATTEKDNDKTRTMLKDELVEVLQHFSEVKQAAL